MTDDKAVIVFPDGTLPAYEQDGSKYTLVASPLSTQQILKIFQRTPKEHIHQRPGKGGGQWDYVTGVYVKKVLNYVFGWLWDFEIVDKGTQGAQIWVHGKLTVKHPKTFAPIIVKHQFGGADIKFKKGTKIPLDYANDLKATATDALKKCASELGIASDIYGKNEFKELGAEKSPAKPKAPQVAVDHDCHGAMKGGCPKGAILSQAQYNYSLKMFKRPLCADCQREAKRK
jgi:hypothetical protein